MPEDSQQNQATLIPAGWSPDVVGRFIGNVGLPSVIVLALLWPTIQLINAVTDAAPIQAAAARESAESSRLMVTVMQDMKQSQADDRKLMLDLMRAIVEKRTP